VFPAGVVAGVKALACEMPATTGTPLARWTCPELARHAAASGITPAPSPSTVRRWLADDVLKPWQHRSWIFPRDPHFTVKAARVLDLYQREWEGHPLGEDEYVLSADEKPGVQARMRIHLPLAPGPGRAMRAESEYHRCGTLAYLAAYDVHRARVFGRCEPSTGIKPFTALTEQVMSAEPYSSARRAFWVVDNGASHRNWAAADRLSSAYPNAQMVHLPVHASWLNQVEVYFSVIQRKLGPPRPPGPPAARCAAGNDPARQGLARGTSAPGSPGPGSATAAPAHAPPPAAHRQAGQRPSADSTRGPARSGRRTASTAPARPACAPGPRSRRPGRSHPR